MSHSDRASFETSRREKVFGPAAGAPLDRNAKARIMVYIKAYNARMKEDGQHIGPITRAFMDVLRALLYTFHNSKDGRCFPSYERIAAAANCCRATVCAAIQALEASGVLTWVHRLTKIRVCERDLCGKVVSRWQVIRTSNAYRFLDPKPGARGKASCKYENPPRPGIQENMSSIAADSSAQGSASPMDEELEKALRGLGEAMGLDLTRIQESLLRRA